VVDEAQPIEIDGHTYLLRYDDADVRKGSDGVEQYITLYSAFFPKNVTYDDAAIFLWKGLKKRTPDGKGLMHIFTQERSGVEDAFQFVKRFCAQFPINVGIGILYGAFHRALIVSGWYRDPEKEQPDKKPVEIDPSKNLQTPTRRQTKTLPSDSADSRSSNSGTTPRPSSSPSPKARSRKRTGSPGSSTP